MDFLTKKDQELIVFMFNNGNKVEKKDQKIFLSLKFYESISKLMRLGLVTSRKKPNSNCNIYYLTDTGIYFAIKIGNINYPRVSATIWFYEP
jgi:hypothetical protein